MQIFFVGLYPKGVENKCLISDSGMSHTEYFAPLSQNFYQVFKDLPTFRETLLRYLQRPNIRSLVPLLGEWASEALVQSHRENLLQVISGSLMV